MVSGDSPSNAAMAFLSNLEMGRGCEAVMARRYFYIYETTCNESVVQIFIIAMQFGDVIQ